MLVALDQVDPRHRLTISDVLERLAAIGESRRFNLKSGMKTTVAPAAALHAAPARPPPAVARDPPQTSPVPPRRPAAPPSPLSQRHNATTVQQPPIANAPSNFTAQFSSSLPNSGLLSSLKGGAGSLFKNLKVIQE